jgi:hypothetical protein
LVFHHAIVLGENQFLGPLVIDMNYERGFANDYCPDERFYDAQYCLFG